jgi:hypothetical protein
VQCVLRLLVRVHLAAGKLPASGQAGRDRTSGGQQLTRIVEVVDDGGCYDEHG